MRHPAGRMSRGVVPGVLEMGWVSGFCRGWPWDYGAGVDGVSELTEAAGLGAATAQTPLSGGRNNRVFKVDTESGTPAVLKAYFHSEDDPRDRLAHEAGFTAYAVDRGIRCVPRLLGQDRDRRLGLFEWIDGVMLEPAVVTPERVGEAMTFFAALNTPEAREGVLAERLPLGSEACLCTLEHLAVIDQRVRALNEVGDPGAASWIEGVLKPWWASLHLPMAKQEDAYAPAPRCVSPSDFGFHNALRRTSGAQAGRMVFHDFEYAGWDDPAKVVGDFMHQPRRPVPLTSLETVLAGVAEPLELDAAGVDRCRRLLPVYGVKWACIVLGPLLPTAAARREHAGAPSPDAASLVERAAGVLQRFA